MSELKTSFRASNGLDAAGEKVINVALADNTVMTDGVNVEYLIQENTVQKYDPLRGYPKGFVVAFNDRLWQAKDIIAKPSGNFNEGFWKAIRTDPKWIAINSGNYQLQVGDYITVDTDVGQAVTFTLPSNAQEGDNIVIKEVGGIPGTVDVLVKAGIQSIIDKGQRLKEIKITVPYSEWVFVYVNKLWNLYNGSEADLAKFIKPGGINQLQSGETIVRQYDSYNPIVAKFPKNANNGDIIHFVGMDSTATPYYNLELNSYDDNTSVISPGVKRKVFQKSLRGFFVYDAATSTWKLYDSDSVDRLRTVNSDAVLFPNETVTVVGTNNSTVQTVNLTLPQNVESGDQITIALNYIRKGQTVVIKAGGSDKILTDQNLTQFPKRSSYPPEGNWVNVTQLSFNGTTDYPPVIKLSYIDMGSIKQWLVVSNVPQLERVDPTDDFTRSRLGVIALATQDQANLDKENITDASKEVAVTPETLANRVALTNRRGIARLSTAAENAYTTGSSSYADDTIVTPKRLDAKQATETMRGLAEIATQTEANTSTDDSRIITAKKLTARAATETLSGIAFVVGANGVENANRASAGTGIFNYNDHSKIVTPKVLREFKASENAQGGGFLATEAEVIAGVDNPAGVPLIVTPFQLHKKTAQEGRIGFTQTATQIEVNAGTDDFKYVTPLKLNSRNATETLTGIARIGTQTEFNAGVLDNVISTPLKLKTFFDTTGHTSVNAASGLTQSGTIWGTVNFNILDATTAQRGTLKTSTQTLVNTGTDTTTAVTPATLHNKKTSTTAEGIVRMSTNAETVTGTSTNVAVSPASLKNAIQVDSTWQATTAIRGTVKMTENAITFVGDNVNGNTQDLNLYQKEGYAISPYELNKTLANYMPLKAKAVDSDLLDGLDSTQFIRRDIDQTVNGNLNLSGKSLTADNVYSRGIVQAQGGIFQSDNGFHYIDVGKTSVNRIILGSYTGQVEIYNTQTLATNVVFSAGGNLRLDGGLNSSTVATTGNATVGSTLYISTQRSLEYITGNLNVGNTTIGLLFKNNDAVNAKIQDPSGTYKILNEKNYVSIGEQTFIKRAGDSVSGRINFTSPITSTIPQSNTKPNAIPDSGNFGTWTVDITDSSIYNTMKGYLVAVPDINAETGQPTGYIKEYQEFKGPGTLSQFGSSDSNGSGTYRIWAPRPPASNANTAGHIAGTFYINHWNPITNMWDGWGRMYTSNNPPTANEIGAMSNNGSVFDSLRIRDWIQVGNLRISADPATKSAKFEWIE